VPIAVQAARHLRSELERVIVVVRSEDLLSVFKQERCEAVLCANAAEGMGASLACAARAAGPSDGYIVALADMPFIRRTSIGAVRHALENGAALAAPYFRARRGHPVGLSGAFYDQLIALGGDEGAKQILAANARRLVKIPIGDPGVIRDIDTPGDLTPPLRV
jgi:molybdenum cofactor cytidylyltransferase